MFICVHERDRGVEGETQGERECVHMLDIINWMVLRVR